MEFLGITSPENLFNAFSQLPRMVVISSTND